MTVSQTPDAGPGQAAGAVRARVALLRPRRHVPRRQAARHRGVRRQAGRLGGQPGQPQRPRRLLPAHGRRPHPGHGQGRRDRVPVPRLALGRRRQVQADPLRPPGPAPRPDPEVPHHDPQRPAPGLARHRGLRGGLRHPAAGAAGRGRRPLHRLDLGDRPHRGLPLPRAHRQRRGHGALLLRALLVPDELPQRLRGHRRDAVHGVQGPARQERRATATPSCSSSPRPPTTDRRT